MIGFQVRLQNEIERATTKAAKEGIYRSLGHAAASVRLTVKRLIVISDKRSKPGEPIHSRLGQAKKAVFYEVDRAGQDAVIGFSHQRMGTSMQVHEEGGWAQSKKGAQKPGYYPARPTIGPALDANRVRFAQSFVDSIGP